MIITVLFHSYFRDLAGCSETRQELASGQTLGDLQQILQKQFPKLKAMERSTLMAVGVEYQPAQYLLQEGDVVSLFHPFKAAKEPFSLP